MKKNLRINVPYKIISAFGPEPKSDNGTDEVIYYCPECINRKGTPDRKGKLYVNINTYKYHCFRCGYSGQIGRVHLDQNKVYDEDREVEVDSLIKMVNEITEGKDEFPLKIPIEKVTESQDATMYLLKRGFTLDQLEYYDMRLGNINFEFGRIVIPNKVDRLVYTDFYSARSFIGQNPKYHNPRTEKSDVVFNLHRIKEGTPIIIVEGALTAVAAGKNAVATLGKFITKSQASQIVKNRPRGIFVNYDYGAEEYTERACEMLYSITKDIPIFKVFMKDERDAADMSYDEYHKCLENAIPYNPTLEGIKNIL